MNDENIDPHQPSRIPQPASKLVPPTHIRKSLEERPNEGSNVMMPPPAPRTKPSGTNTTVGRSKIQLSGLAPSQMNSSRRVVRGTGLPRPNSAHSMRPNSSQGIMRNRSDSDCSSKSTEDSDERIQMLTSVLSQKSEERERFLLQETRRLQNQINEWDLEKKKLNDTIEDLDQKIREERDQYNAQLAKTHETLQKTHDNYREKMNKLEEKVYELTQEKMENQGKLNLELSNKTIELQEQMRLKLEDERAAVKQKLANKFQSDLERKDREIGFVKERAEEEARSLQQKHHEEIQKLWAQFEQDKKSQQDNYWKEVQRVQDEARQTQLDDRKKYDQYANDLKTSLDGELSKQKELVKQLEYKHTQERKRFNDEIENEMKKSKTLQQQVYELREQLESEQHETSTLRKALAEVSESSNSIESVAKSQQTQIDELQYQLESQKQKASEARHIAQQANEERDNAKAKLLREEIHRRKLHNQVQELKGNIRVFCRVRPVLPHERDNAGAAQIEFPDLEEGGQEIALTGTVPSMNGSPTTKLHTFQFDKVFNPNCNNLEVFEEISQLVQSALDGYNVCIFAYGQTGSGKTHTMSAEDDGMIPRAVNQIFQTAESMKERGWEYELEGQFLEIYNENLNDLLGKSDMLDQTKLEIRHDQQNHKTTVTDLTTVKLTSPEQVHRVLQKALKNRSVAATKVNERSSRSHSVFMLKIRGSNSITGKVHEGTLNLIDLAGSERLSQSQVKGDRLKETQAINKSLSALGDVIYSLGNSKEGSHVPYRNSKLTYLLQYSLSGNSKTLMFVNVSPLEPHVNETVSSLRFATKVNNTKIKK